MPRQLGGRSRSWRRWSALALCGLITGCAADGTPSLSFPNPSKKAARIRACRPAKSVRQARYEDKKESAKHEASQDDAAKPADPLALPLPEDASSRERFGDSFAPYPLDFSQALERAGGAHPRVYFAQARIQQAFAQLEQAKVLWLPTIRAGASYSHHDGRLQPAAGNIAEVNRFATFQGFGTRAIGSGPPAVPGLSAEFHLADACYQPKIAAQVAQSRNHAFSAESNDVLLDTALAYLNLLETKQQTAIADETLKKAKTLADLTSTFAQEGEGPQADADRAQTEYVFRQLNLERAREAEAVAQARLVQQLSLDAVTKIEPLESSITPIELVAESADPHELVATGLANRHELAESRHLVAAACQRLRREKTAPLVPSLILRASYGGFGGGNNHEIDDYSDRFDVDLGAFWEVRNLGFGEKAARDEAAAQVQLAQATQLRLLDQVAREVVEAHAQVRARRGQIETAQNAIKTAEQAFDHEVERIRQGQGLPIETLQSIQALDLARRTYLRAVVEYNQAQFRLHRALGWPGPVYAETVELPD